ncbi:MAG: MFS transporter, partial [Peptostreptococcaceae bacterium]|nr:MFS transporter [Peptostreptococcaceae bacterium]
APQDLGVGTSLVNFTNSLSGLIAAALFGLAYDINTSGNTESLSHITAGVNTVFLLASVVSFIGLAIVLLLVRKQVNDKAKETKKA